MIAFETQELEQWLLGGLILNNAAIIEIKLKPSDFGLPHHARFFEDMQRLFESKGKFELADFADWQFDEQFKDIYDGDTAFKYLQDLAMYSPTKGFTDSLKTYAEKIIEIRSKARLVGLFEGLKMKIHETSYADLCNEIMVEIEQLEAKGIKSSEDVYSSILESMKLPADYSPTGLHELDKCMAGGLYQGFTYGLCGAEKAGKTTLAHTISYNLAQNNKKHLYVALEMGSEQIEQRNIARELQVNSIKFLRNVKSLIPQMKNIVPRKNLWYYDAPGGTQNEILNAVTQAKIKHGIEGFIVDYWQLISGNDSRNTEEKHLRDVAQAIANYARKNGLWCILLAQMNKDGKLFGGNGLRKACDQLYMIEQYEDDLEDYRWLRMDASRYTLRVDCGDESTPSLMMNKYIGPYFEDAEYQREAQYSSLTQGK